MRIFGLGNEKKTKKKKHKLYIRCFTRIKFFRCTCVDSEILLMYFWKRKNKVGYYNNIKKCVNIILFDWDKIQ